MNKQKSITEQYNKMLAETTYYTDVPKEYSKKFPKAYKCFHELIGSAQLENYMDPSDGVFINLIQGDEVDSEEVEEAFEWLEKVLKRI